MITIYCQLIFENSSCLSRSRTFKPWIGNCLLKLYSYSEWLRKARLPPRSYHLSSSAILFQSVSRWQYYPPVLSNKHQIHIFGLLFTLLYVFLVLCVNNYVPFLKNRDNLFGLQNWWWGKTKCNNKCWHNYGLFF